MMVSENNPHYRIAERYKEDPLVSKVFRFGSTLYIYTIELLLQILL